MTQINVFCIFVERIIFNGFYALVAKSAERNHGKVEVCGSIPHEGFNTESGFIKRNCFLGEYIMGSKKKGAVELIALQCSECKRKNYTTSKNRKNIQGKLELNKYCPWDKKHTLHKETKIK